MRSGGSGAEDGTRTRDLLITNQLLYQLSYFGGFGGAEDDIRGRPGQAGSCH